MKAQRWCRCIALFFLQPRVGWVVNATPRPLYPPGKTRYPLYRRLGGQQGRSGRVRKISPPPGFDPRTAQPVASRYTDWGIPANTQYLLSVQRHLATLEWLISADVFRTGVVHWHHLPNNRYWPQYPVMLFSFVFPHFPTSQVPRNGKINCNFLIWFVIK